MDDAPDRDLVLAEAGDRLVEAVVAELPAWVAAAIERRCGDHALSARQVTAAASAGVDHVGARLRALVVLDVDAQRQSPLALVREAAAFPTDVLVAIGAAPVPRDADQVRLQPDDLYDLVPATFADIGPATAEAGLIWGAAKALAHRARHDR